MRQASAIGMLVALTIGSVLIAWQPSPVILKQERDGAPAVNLTGAELESLGDPFFELVLKRDGSVTSLAAIETLLQPNAEQRHTFVVDENIIDPRQGQQRRAVISFVGSNGGTVLDSNVMLSVAFSSASFPDAQRFLEAWGWDNQRGRYNYYKLDRTGTPDSRMTWKFRGSSVDADLLSPGDRVGTCLQCHINGAPVMKELPFPWNNWHSVAAQSNTKYLTMVSPPSVRWPVVADPHLSASRLKAAEDLEVGGILPSITQFNNRRVNAHLVRSDTDGNIEIRDGRATIIQGRRLLRSLFVTTEVNLGSASQRSGLHPLPAINQSGPGQDVVIPGQFFLNVNLLAGGTPAQYKGLGLTNAQQLGRGARLSPAEYTKLVLDAGLELVGRQPGDAEFAWFTPEASHIDNDLVDRLLQRGIVTPKFVAAVAAVDLETPVFSTRRAGLLRNVPDTFTFAMPANPNGPDELLQMTVAELERTNPKPGTAEAELLLNLKDPDPISKLRNAIDAYGKRIDVALKTPSTRSAELKRLFDVLLLRRIAMLNDPVLGALDETGDRLLPLPPLSRRPITGSGGQVIK